MLFSVSVKETWCFIYISNIKFPSLKHIFKVKKKSQFEEKNKIGHRTGVVVYGYGKIL